MPNKKLIQKFSFSHPDQILYPGDNITKQELANYYLSISENILPHIVNRPLTLVRCPKGIDEKCFYQKHIYPRLRLSEDSNTENHMTELSEGIYTVEIAEKHGKDTYLYIKDISGLMALVQMGVLEIHPWGCHVSNIEQPDLIVFDLDPSEEVEWKKVIQTAKLLRDLLQDLGLISFVKTTGGKGLHVVLPIKPSLVWAEVVTFAHAFTNLMVNQNPQELIGTMSKEKRKGKIFIDYLRNNRGATAIAAYSTRAKINAPVACPLGWKELTPRVKSNSYNIHNLKNRLTKLKKDPWEEFFNIEQTIPKEIFATK